MTRKEKYNFCRGRWKYLPFKGDIDYIKILESQQQPHVGDYTKGDFEKEIEQYCIQMNRQQKLNKLKIK